MTINSAMVQIMNALGIGGSVLVVVGALLWMLGIGVGLTIWTVGMIGLAIGLFLYRARRA